MAHVLVVEDNPLNMKLAVFLLQNAGHQVLCAVDAERALVFARMHRPALILMDCQLPRMDGLSATALLKQDPATAMIPVVALTALALPAAALDPAAHLFDACICKPLRYQELYAVVNALLHQRPQPHSQAEPAPAPTALRAPAGVVEVRVLEALVGQDPAVVRGFLAEFQSSAAAIGVELQAACAARQVLLAGQLAHKLKSAAYAVGALALGQRCAAMEAAGAAGDAQLLATLWPLFALELQAVHHYLEVLLAPD